MNNRLDRASRWRSRWKELFWLIGLWAAGVLSVALVAALIRLAMGAIGFKSH
ncbi:DUF2474 domain-containing protein [Cupriavidus sp. YAF13]|uniref:DUF2474 domain-containing protein n=1 Tax=Cupriavidus sp. YAF13 TaxID=3233075 RepID=UPI003F9261B4